MKFVAALVLALVPLSQSDTDCPHRDWGQTISLDMTAPEAAACITRQMARLYGRVIPVPAEGGTDIEGGPGGGFFGTAHDPWVSYQVRSAANVTTLRIFYRHPVSQKNISRDVRRMGDKCLKIAAIRPA